MAVGFGHACPKTRKPPNAKRGITARERSRRRAKKLALEIAIKALVRIRDNHQCRVCGRRAESVHEIKSKGAGGDVSLTNSIACCGDGVQRCHGFLQRYEITVGHPFDANEMLTFTIKSAQAQAWVNTF